MGKLLEVHDNNTVIAIMEAEDEAAFKRLLTEIQDVAKVAGTSNFTPTTPTPQPSSGGDDDSGLGAGVIAGIVVAAVAVVGLAGFGIYKCRKEKVDANYRNVSL